jgi:hypothetical protein
MQTAGGSLLEITLNIGTGMIISWIVTIYLLPFWGYAPSPQAALEITVLYTVISVIRSYVWRRVFNHFIKLSVDNVARQR